MRKKPMVSCGIFCIFFAAAGKKFVAEGIPNEKGRAKARPFALFPAK
ncbi:MAG: hypothetical protein MRZ99_00925 [Clostridiales bacterium]|nr:hypothetical protein [Clostridiales bacterium]